MAKNDKTLTAVKYAATRPSAFTAALCFGMLCTHQKDPSSYSYIFVYILLWGIPTTVHSSFLNFVYLLKTIKIGRDLTQA